MKSAFVLIAALFLAVSASAADPYGSFSKNGFRLGGSEFWPYKGTTPFSYPKDVVWGFSPTTGVTPEALTCAKTSWAVLYALLDAPPADLIRLKELGSTSGFFLWTNDYKLADASVRRRSARMWHWSSSGSTPPYSSGLFKWEGSTTQDGTCLPPDSAQYLPEMKRLRLAAAAKVGFDVLKTQFAGATPEKQALIREELGYLMQITTSPELKEQIRLFLESEPS